MAPTRSARRRELELQLQARGEAATCCTPGALSLAVPKIGRGGTEGVPDLGEEKGDRLQEEPQKRRGEDARRRELARAEGASRSCCRGRLRRMRCGGGWERVGEGWGE